MFGSHYLTPTQANAVGIPSIFNAQPSVLNPGFGFGPGYGPLYENAPASPGAVPMLPPGAEPPPSPQPVAATVPATPTTATPATPSIWDRIEQSLQSPVMGLAMGIMSGKGSNFGNALGSGLTQGVRNMTLMQRTEIARKEGERRERQAEEERKIREKQEAEKAEQRAKFEAWVNTLSPEQAQIVRAIPGTAETVAEHAMGGLLTPRADAETRLIAQQLGTTPAALLASDYLRDRQPGPVDPTRGIINAGGRLYDAVNQRWIDMPEGMDAEPIKFSDALRLRDEALQAGRPGIDATALYQEAVDLYPEGLDKGTPTQDLALVNRFGKILAPDALTQGEVIAIQEAGGLRDRLATLLQQAKDEGSFTKERRREVFEVMARITETRRKYAMERAQGVTSIIGNAQLPYGMTPQSLLPVYGAMPAIPALTGNATPEQAAAAQSALDAAKQNPELYEGVSRPRGRNRSR